MDFVSAALPFIKVPIGPPLSIKKLLSSSLLFLNPLPLLFNHHHSASPPFSFLISFTHTEREREKMHPLPPPPPYTPTPLKQTKPSFYQVILSMQARKQQSSIPETHVASNKLRTRDQPILRQPRRTNPVVWFGAILCLLFSLLLIFFGIATLIIFVAVKPRTPVFDTPAASLSVIYFDSPEFLNGDITFLANFTNPNRKLSVRFEYLNIELYFSESLVATHILQPFSQKPGEVRLIQVHLLSSLVYLPPNLALQLQRQEQMNRVVYNIKANFRVKLKLGVVHYSYSLHGNCQLEMTSPPNGALITHSCRTKR